MPKVNTQNMGLSSVGGLGRIYFEELDRDASDGTFDHKTAGTDVFGDAFTTLHIMGSQEESTPSRDENGVNSLDVTVFETDVDRANMIELVAPVSSASASEAEEVTLEDGTKYGGSGSSDGDTNKPYFIFYWFLATLAGKKRCRVFVGQFEPQGGLQGQKGNQRNRVKFTVKSVDGKGFTPTLPSANADFDDMTAPALTGNFKHGKVITAV